MTENLDRASLMYDEREAVFLLDQFCERHKDASSLVKPGDRHAAVMSLVEDFERLAKRAGLGVQRKSRDVLLVWILDDDDFSATVTVTSGAKILVQRATPTGPLTNEVPVRFNAVTVTLEGARPSTLPPHTEPWQTTPRSALAVLTEEVLAGLEGRRT